jgi:hypothetical protein
MKKIYYFIVILFFISGCLDPIDLKVPLDFGVGLVIQGGVFKTKNKTLLKVFTSLPSDDRGQTRLIKVLDICIENDKGQKIFINDLSDDGSYTLDFSKYPDFNTNFGTKFRLTATSFDKNIYQTSFETLIETPKIDKIYYEVQDRFINGINGSLIPWKYFALFLDIKSTIVANEKRRLKFDVFNSYKFSSQLLGEDVSKVCYVTSRVDLTTTLLFDGFKSDKTNLLKFPVYDTPIESQFSEDYYGLVVLSSLSAEGLNYYRQINELNNRVGSIFEPAGSTIISNVKNLTDPSKPGFGYFYASEQDTVLVNVKPSSVGFPLRQCPVEPSETSPCPVRSCCDCLILQGASVQKPSFWK